MICSHLQLWYALALTTTWIMALILWLRDAWQDRARHALELEMWLKVGGTMRMICRPNDLHTILFVGPGFESVVGWTAAEMQQRSWLEFVHPDDKALAEKFIERGHCGECSSADPMQLTVRWQHKNPSPTTRWVWLEWSATYIPSLHLCFSNARDLTSKFEQDASVAVWSRITSDLLAIGDTTVPIEERKFDWLNEAWTRSLGWSLAELYSMRIMDLVEPSETVAVLTTWPELEGPNATGQMECRLKCKAAPGEAQCYRYFQWNTVEMNGRMYVTGHDIGTERDQRHELEQAVANLEARNRDLERFASVAAHQLRSPPRTITGIAQALKEDFGHLLDAEGQQFVDDILLDADHMAEIVDGLYRFSKVRTSADIQIEPVDLNRVMETVIESRAKQRCTTCPNGAVCPNARPPVPHCPNWREVINYDPLPEVLGDQVMLREILGNLVDNGMKFNESVHKTVTVSASARPDGRWNIHVRDNGIGIDPKYHAKLFQMFERIHPQYSGTGVGLALVAAIVNKLGGKISVESEAGQGATFTFDLEGAWTR